jgi:hypothetical protein
VDHEQTAFVPSRQIGDNIRFLQILPPSLSEMGMMFCDFIKACITITMFNRLRNTYSSPNQQQIKYDNSVDRGFLWQIFQRCGIGERYLSWVRLLYFSTHACVRVNGHLSEYREFKAGVRQGCLLAPFLYLMITQALLSTLIQKD